MRKRTKEIKLAKNILLKRSCSNCHFSKYTIDPNLKCKKKIVVEDHTCHRWQTQDNYDKLHKEDRLSSFRLNALLKELVRVSREQV